MGRSGLAGQSCQRPASQLMKNFFAELKRRNVYKVAVAYAVAAWLLVQVATQVFPFFEIPNWSVRLVVLALILGFPIALVMAWAFEITPEGIKREEDVAPNESISRQTGRKIVGITIALAVVAAGLFAFQIFRPRLMRDSTATSTPVTATAALAIPEKSIAVLPMVNSSDDPANEYFSDGMSEEFISSLSRLRDLKVIGRSSSFQFKGRTANSKAIGEKLGVYYLLEGSVQRAADRVRIWVDLIKSGDGTTLWSESYDRDLKDVFAMQSEIAGKVAKELKVALLGKNGQTAQLATTATPSNENVEAYNALLQGNFFGRRATAEDTRKAIGYYEEAIRIDPRYALAYAKLSIQAEALANNYSSLANNEKQEVTAKARAAAERALQLAPSLAEAHMAKGYILHLFDLDFAGAEAEFHRASELAPNDPGAANILASLLATLGQLEEAVALEQRAIELDPLRNGVHQALAVSLTSLGRYDEAEAALRKEMTLQPQAALNHLWLAIIQILRGQPASAVELAKQETDPFWRTYALAQACFVNGDRAQADAELKKMIDTDADGAGSQIAAVYALRKEPDKMFEWLDHAWRTQDPGVAQMLFDPFLRAYKDDPRFVAFAQKIWVMPKAATHP
jgi:TolB-like protein/Flp pilus assembly protein TadD